MKVYLLSIILFLFGYGSTWGADTAPAWFSNKPVFEKHFADGSQLSIVDEPLGAASQPAAPWHAKTSGTQAIPTTATDKYHVLFSKSGEGSPREVWTWTASRVPFRADWGSYKTLDAYLSDGSQLLLVFQAYPEVYVHVLSLNKEKKEVALPQTPYAVFHFTDTNGPDLVKFTIEGSVLRNSLTVRFVRQDQSPIVIGLRESDHAFKWVSLHDHRTEPK